MSIAVVVMTDGRDTIADTIASFESQVTGPVTHRVIHDDSGDKAYRKYLQTSFPEYRVIGGRRSGFGGAIIRAWRHLRTLPVDWVFHLEDDFTFNRPVDLTEFAEVLFAHPHILQMALRRQPWSESEAQAGGIVEENPDSYTDQTDGVHEWLEHRLFFTTNPSLYRRTLCDLEWPQGSQSEGRFSLQVLSDPLASCAYWGSRNSGEWVTHNGAERRGRGY